MAEPPALEVQGLNIAFAGRDGPVPVVRDVALSVARGQLHALVGESGSGKSVTARAVMGLLPRAAARAPGATIRLGGEDIARLPEAALRRLRGRRMAMIFQEPMSSLNPLHSIADQLVEAIRVHQRVSAKAALARAGELLDEVGLPDPAAKLRQYPHELSGGQRQRVMIAMALCNRPELLIADEPTTALDVIVQAQILQLLRDLRERYTMGVLLITHDLTLVRRHADVVSVMERGAIVESGPTRALFAAPRHPYTRALLAAEPTGAAPAAPAASSPAAPLLAGEGLRVAFQARPHGWRRTRGAPLVAVDDVSVMVARGDAVGIVGESGSGKTTLGLALLRLVAHQAGTIAFDGRPIGSLDRRAMRPLRARMQVVLQDPFASLNPRLSVGQIVGEGLIVNGLGASDRDRADRVRRALREAGMPDDILERFPHEFSGGQRQRLSIARALAVEPEFLLLDEPTSALDLSVQAQVLALLARLRAERGLTYLFISHDLKVVRALCPRLIVMKSGRIVEQGATAAILADPQNAYTRRLVRAAFDVAA